MDNRKGNWRRMKSLRQAAMGGAGDMYARLDNRILPATGDPPWQMSNQSTM